MAILLLISAGKDGDAQISQIISGPSVVVFDSFGPGNSYLTSVAWGVSGASTSGGYRGQAEKFVPGISGYLSSITLATVRVGGSGRSDFFIAEDALGVPGSILETYANTLDAANGLLTLNSTSQPLLQAGVTYWVCDQPADATSSTGWFENSQNVKLGFAFDRAPWDWSAIDPPNAPSSGVMRISVIAVPEPGSIAVMCVALGVTAVRRRTAINTALQENIAAD